MRQRRTVSVLAPRSEVHSSFCNPWRIFGDDGKNSTVTRESQGKKRKQTRIPGKEQTGNHKKKEERFNPGGQVSMRWRRTVSVLVPHSNVHKHPVTLGESLEMMEKIELSPRDNKKRRIK